MYNNNAPDILDDFEEIWQSAERQYQSASSQLQSIIKVLPTITQSQRDEYGQQGNECLDNIQRSITDLNQLFRKSSQRA